MQYYAMFIIIYIEHSLYPSASGVQSSKTPNSSVGLNHWDTEALTAAAMADVVAANAFVSEIV